MRPLLGCSLLRAVTPGARKIKMRVCLCPLSVQVEGREPLQGLAGQAQNLKQVGETM